MSPLVVQEFLDLRVNLLFGSGCSRLKGMCLVQDHTAARGHDRTPCRKQNESDCGMGALEPVDIPEGCKMALADMAVREPFGQHFSTRKGRRKSGDVSILVQLA